MKPMKKKGQLSGLFQATLMLVMIVVVVGLGVIVLGEMASITGLADSAVNALNNGSTAIGSISTTWASIIVIILVVGLILGILLGSFALRRQR